MKNAGALPLLLLFIPLTLQAAAATHTIFDVPAAGTNSGQGTYAFVINNSGTITGYCLDAFSTYHGFVRSGAGTITTFDAPGAHGFLRTP